MATVNKQIEELFEAQAHLGHKTNRIHPRSRKYIYKVENGVSIIDLSQTVELFTKAKEFSAQLGEAGKTFLVVATKKIASSFVEETAKKNDVPYIVTKWPAGFISNFETLLKNINKLKKMKEDKEAGEWAKLVKHEQTELGRELAKLERNYGGLVSLTALPDALFIVDIKKEKNAVKEACAVHIPVVAITDTNVNPDSIDYPIPANDDSLTSIEYITTQVIEAYTKARLKKK